MAIKRISFTHEALVNWLVENPERSLRDCAEYFGYTQSWLSQIIHSDIFQARLGARQDAVFAQVAQDIPAKLRGITDVALEKLGRKIEEVEDADFILDATDKLLHRNGYAPNSSRNVGGPNSLTVNQQVNVFAVDRNMLADARALQRTVATVGISQIAEVGASPAHGEVSELSE